MQVTRGYRPREFQEFDIACHRSATARSRASRTLHTSSTSMIDVVRHA